MKLTAHVGRRCALAVALLAAGVALVGLPAGAVPAGPGAPITAPDPEGGTKTLREQLEAAARGYIDAKARYDFSKRAEAVLLDRIRATELRLALLTEQVSVVAAASYRTGRLGVVTALLESGSPDAFLARAASVELLVLQEDSQLAELSSTRRLLAQQRDRIAAEVTMQTIQLAEMEKKKREAERALAAVGGQVSGGFVSGGSAAARPAPRNADGTWPRESCTVDDPTTSGCLTPRMYHTYQQARVAGFTRYTSCYRPSGYGEHPKGRACDFAASASGFGGAAYGSDKTYGDRLASWAVYNANRLGIMYVIWYRQIWMPGTGWRSYSAGSDPASAHTNHVHISVY